MKLKKNPKANLEHYSGVFTMLGLVLTLFITYVFIEHKSYAAVKTIDYNAINYDDDDVKTIQFKRIKKIPKKVEIPVEMMKPKELPKITDPNHIEKVKNDIDIIETKLIQENTTTETNDLKFEDIEYVPDVVEYEPETIGYMSVENMPVYPGCEKYMGDLEKSKKCFNKNISKFFGKNFDIGLADELNLTGLQRINCSFIIDHNGEISPDIRTSKTHPELAKEIKEVLRDLPKMKPARQNGRTVNLMYSLPVRFMVE